MAIATTYDWDEVEVRELDLYAQEAASHRIDQFEDADGNVVDPSSWTLELKVYPLHDYSSSPVQTYTRSGGDLQVDSSNYVAWNLTDAQTDTLGAGWYSYALRVNDNNADNDPYFSMKGTLKVHDVSE